MGYIACEDYLEQSPHAMGNQYWQSAKATLRHLFVTQSLGLRRVSHPNGRAFIVAAAPESEGRPLARRGLNQPDSYKRSMTSS